MTVIGARASPPIPSGGVRTARHRFAVKIPCSLPHLASDATQRPDGDQRAARGVLLKMGATAYPAADGLLPDAAGR